MEFEVGDKVINKYDKSKCIIIKKASHRPPIGTAYLCVSTSDLTHLAHLIPAWLDKDEIELDKQWLREKKINSLLT